MINYYVVRLSIEFGRIELKLKRIKELYSIHVSIPLKKTIKG